MGLDAESCFDLLKLLRFNEHMLLSFIESLKYVGHLLPISFLRIFLGLYYVDQAVKFYKTDFLLRPRLADSVAEFLPTSQAPEWLKFFLSNQIVPHWQFFAFAVWSLYVMIGISYSIGYVVRPVAIIGAMLSILFLFISGPVSEDFYKTLIVIHVMFAWLGAGRCLGVDYYFFKRRRGIWW